MQLIKSSDLNLWNKFVKANALDGGFLQSSGWAKFQENFGRQVWCLEVREKDEVLAIVILIKQPLKRLFNYFYAPRGPVIKKDLTTEKKQELISFLTEEIKSLAIQEKVSFLRFDPAWENNEILIVNNFKFIGSVQPASTLILDLSLTEEELLAKMKSKTRYNIRVAQKHQVEIKLTTDPAEKFEEFYALLVKTAQRDKIKIHSKNYYRRMLEISDCCLVVASYQDKIISANLMVFFGDWAIYLHGASDYEFRDKMAPYLLQWEMIKTAKNKGCQFYDFWGADSEKWPGVTRFKVGFAPEITFIKYVGAYDFVYNGFLYGIYGIIKKIMK